MPKSLMQLKVLQPFRMFADISGVLRIVAETRQGSFGILPHRLDCVAALTPGILLYETAAAGEVCLAIDAGVLVKTGSKVCVSVRMAIAGANLGQLRHLVEKEFLTLNVQDQSFRLVMSKLESGLIRGLVRFQHE